MIPNRVNLQRSPRPDEMDLGVPASLHTHVHLNGREIAEAVYEDAGTKMARSMWWPSSSTAGSDPPDPGDLGLLVARPSVAFDTHHTVHRLSHQAPPPTEGGGASGRSNRLKARPWLDEGTSTFVISGPAQLPDLVVTEPRLAQATPD